MIRNSWPLKLYLILTIGLGTGLGMLVVAQEEDEPVAKTPKGKKAADPEAPVEKVIDDPVIVQLRESAPTTLDQLTRALRITSQLARDDEFKIYAADWLKLTPSDATLAALNRKYGTDFFFELARREELQPEGEQIAKVVLDGASKYAHDPARLNDLTNKLSDSATNTAALRGLREAGETGIVALVRALADDTFKGDRQALRNALAALGRDSVEPLIAALAAPLPETRADAATVLGRLNSRRAIPYLIGLSASDVDSPERTAARAVLGRLDVPTPDARAASKFLAQRIHSLLTGEVVGKLDANDEVPLWRWSDEAHSVQRERYPQDQAALIVADRLAEQLSGLTKDRGELQLALLVQLEADQTVAGFDQPPPQGQGTAWERAHALGIEIVEGALVDAIELDRPTAIAAVLEVLAASGRSELLTSKGGRESPLVIALGYPDRRVQVAALKAILALDPSESYPGASRVVETMKYLLTSSGQGRVLVGHPRFDESSRIGALYGELGYECDSAATGRAVIRQAAASADYELILISETIDGPNVQETVQTLRKDPRTARIPIGILEHLLVLNPKFFPGEIKDLIGPNKNKVARPLTAEQQTDRLLADERHAPQRLPGGKAEKAAGAVKLAVVVPLPQSPESLHYVHDQVMRLAPSRQVAPEIRLEQTYYLLEQLAELLSRKQPPAFYDFTQLESALIASSRVPPLSAQAATVLGLLGTPKAQLTLVEQASLSANVDQDRSAAIKAFGEAVQRRGIALTQVQIQRLYDRHKQSTPEQQRQLREVLDIIEAPTAKAREEKRKLLPK